MLVIIAQGQLSNLRHLQFNWGDIIIVFNMMVFAVYAVYLRKRPSMHWMSFIFVFGAVSALTTLPFMVWEMAAGITFKPTWLTFFAIVYVCIFPSVLAFAAWNRGVQLIGANRSGPFVHLVPLYTAIFGSVLLNEHLSTFHIFGFALIMRPFNCFPLQPFGTTGLRVVPGRHPNRFNVGACYVAQPLMLNENLRI